jgi:hypothetical protein
MRLSELRDYIWADNAQQRSDILAAVHDRLGPDDEVPEPEALDHVRVMTMHGAKGLSARVVFIPGLEQGLLPNRHQQPYVGQLLEAARLLYVSITEHEPRVCCPWPHIAPSGANSETNSPHSLQHRRVARSGRAWAASRAQRQQPSSTSSTTSSARFPGWMLERGDEKRACSCLQTLGSVLVAGARNQHYLQLWRPAA